MENQFQLTITAYGSPRKMNRRLKDGTVVPDQDRFFFTVDGDPKAVAQYKRDTKAGKNGSGRIADDGGLWFFSWNAAIGGTAVIKRSAEGYWFVERAHIAKLNSYIAQIPSAADAIAKKLWEECFGEEKPKNRVTPVEEGDDE